MADNEQRAINLLAEAESKLKPAGFISGIFGGGNRSEEACELFTKAANSFKMAKKWSSAGNAFLKAGNIQIKAGNRHEAGTNFVDAGNCFKKSEPLTAVECYQRAIEIYTDMGRFNIAAKHHVSIAELFENELNDIDKAIVHYEQAAEYYKGEESHSSANKLLLQVAKYSAQLEKYDKAIEIYEQVATTNLDSSLLKYSAKEQFFRAALCHLCVDTLNATHALNKYDEMYPSFADSREYKLIKTLIAKLEDQDLDGFTQAVADYDSISRLDQWYTTMLLRVKKTLQGESDLC
ncbi:alpha-soluble NSF attachment protein [Galendromus occidentalis]|uniref:Alpha-soluble NSF attachment protein n=1 Tax=Galendromus occidentalis TaxID=34638 RepID=A0AAJ6VZM9_9ACAR|nr:alpha-soluble NSF attachment protein [Galendromus occidentalis]